MRRVVTPGRAAFLAVWTAAGLAAAGCLPGAQAGSGLLAKPTLVAGVRPDLPGIGEHGQGGSFQGLDVDVATYIAHALGKRVRIVPTVAADRERFLLKEKSVDIVLTYWVRADWKTRITFAGPYVPSYQDILVRADEQRIRNVHDLAGRPICAVRGAGASDLVIKGLRVPARPVPTDGYNQCTTMLRDGQIDAITTNDTILAGLRNAQGASFRLLNARFGEQRTGIGMRPGDPDGCEAVNKAITQMYQDGTMAKTMRRWFGGSGLDLSVVAVPQFEGCE
ncbi:transporter substrate-binding domain-containing protein [Actinomadura rupiterrae]|uniref:transporter substrate-binding domain-containing protein n=1 Tax=Actinomadura rupiterrae TaxID=559627 RepID=UPI0020A53B10|nr:transporter substrate-binding domain-containing protein [Actinomadura rupiterrae]MCP2341834.1 glutamate transport system substrate-binding protein [Actinomadura rupiterrae]